MLFLLLKADFGSKRKDSFPPPPACSFQMSSLRMWTLSETDNFYLSSQHQRLCCGNKKPIHEGTYALCPSPGSEPQPDCLGGIPSLVSVGCGKCLSQWRHYCLLSQSASYILSDRCWMWPIWGFSALFLLLAVCSNIFTWYTLKKNLWDWKYSIIGPCQTGQHFLSSVNGLLFRVIITVQLNTVSSVQNNSWRMAFLTNTGPL